MRQPLSCLFLLLSVIAAPVGAADQTVQRQEGRAYATADGRLLYRETHWLQGPASAQSRLVLYRCSDGRPFARKWMTPQGSPQTPDFTLDDGRDGYQEGVRGGAATRQVSVRASAQAPTFSRAIAVPPGAVVDAGFDAAVRSHWAALQAGQSVAFQFLLPSRQRLVPLKLQRTGAVTWQGQPAEQLQMKLDAWFGFAVPPVTLVYATADQRLLQFTGTGNVRDEKGKYPQVRVEFPAAPVATPAAELSAARTQPLVKTCGA
ncbi:hypothetical protein [Stenotrophomonas sp. TWI587]|jgi:hypothetical protein|uniref:hypothetical protein n=1 Tax=Stenotrophomonas sp. TWI587 TaxID=3136783 RepID=UPI00320A250A